MDKTSAENIVCTSIRAVALFNQLVRELQATLPKDEFELQRREIGRIMGNICVDLLDPTAFRGIQQSILRPAMAGKPSEGCPNQIG
jgi:hypothetical protein